MSLNFYSLKLEFIEYIEKKEEENGKDLYEINVEDNIFLYADEFKEFIKEEHAELAGSMFEELTKEESKENNTENDKKIDLSKIYFRNLDKLTSEENLNEILGMINDEQEMQAEEIENTNNETLESAENAENTNKAEYTEEEQLDFMNNMIAELLNNEDVKAFTDANGDEEINQEELLGLINTIKFADNNETNVSFEDIINGVKYINGEINPENTDDTEQVNKQPELATPNSVKRKAQNQPTYTNLSKTYLKNLNNSNTTSNTNINSEAEKSIPVLEKQVQDCETNLANEQADVSNIENGVQEVYDEIAANDEKRAEDINALKEEKQSLDNINIEISDLDTKISQFDNTLSNISSRKSTLEGQKSELDSAYGQEENADRKSTIENQLQALEYELEQLNAQEEDINKQKTDAEKQKEEKIAQKEEIETKIASLEEKINFTEEEKAKIKEAEDKYQKDLQTAQEEVKVATEKLNEAKTALTLRQNEESRKVYSADKMSDVAKSALELAFKQIGICEDAGDNRGTMEKYGAGAGNPWCAAFVSWVYGQDKNCPLNFTASVSNLMQQGMDANKYSNAGSYLPVPGDVMIQKNNGASHTGIVTGCDGEYIYTIEGNSGDAVRERKYRIGSSEYAKISGFIRMNEWTGGGEVDSELYLDKTNGEDADKKKRATY